MTTKVIRNDMRLSQLHLNEGQISGVPSNPRIITEEEFNALKRSICNFVKMLSIRKIIVDENMVILGGNMRYQALLKLAEEKAVAEVKDREGNIVSYYHFDENIPEEWVEIRTDLSEEEKRCFIQQDNEERGMPDWDKLANEWDEEELIKWDIHIPHWETPEEEKKRSISKEERITIFVPSEYDGRKDEIELLIKLALDEYPHCTIK